MKQESKSLFEQVGGQEAVKLLVLKLYDKILQDDLLSPFFENVSVEKLRASQNAFIQMALGGPHLYTGKSLRHAHRPLVDRGLSDVHFNAVKKHMMISMRELNVANDLIDKTMNIVETTRDDILCRGQEKD